MKKLNFPPELLWQSNYLFKIKLVHCVIFWKKLFVVVLCSVKVLQFSLTNTSWIQLGTQKKTPRLLRMCRGAPFDLCASYVPRYIYDSCQIPPFMLQTLFPDCAFASTYHKRGRDTALHLFFIKYFSLLFAPERSHFVVIVSVCGEQRTKQNVVFEI